MPRHCQVPEDLKNQPFTLDQARAYGLTRDHLRGREWKRISRGWYRWAGCGLSESCVSRQCAEWCPQTLPFAAGPRHASWGSTSRPHANQRSSCRDRQVSPSASRLPSARARLSPAEVVTRDGLRFTSAARTCFDLAGELSLVEGVVVVDMTLHAELMTLERFRSYVETRSGVPGIRGARLVLEFAEPRSESPMESRLRMLLVGGGLPRRRLRSRSTLTMERSRGGSISTMRTRASASSTTARTTGTASPTTTAGRTDAPGGDLPPPLHRP